jgi:putative membrane protein
MALMTTAPRRDGGALLRALLLFLIATFLVYLIQSGLIRYYIHPRFTWFTWVATGGICLMASSQLLRFLTVRGGEHPPVAAGLYGALALVVAVGYVLPPHKFGADLAQRQGINLTDRRAGGTVNAGLGPDQPAVNLPSTSPGVPTETSGNPPVAGQPPAGGASGSKADAGTASPSTPANASPAPAPPASGQPGKYALQIEGDRIIITPRNYMRSMIELYDHPEKYVGMKVAYDGFVLYPPDAGPLDWTLVRLVVTCHVAHAYPDGLLIVRDGLTERPAQDAWLRVDGVLEPYVYKGQKVIRLRATSLQPISAPADPYVYP